MTKITYEDFEKVEMRIGKIIKAENFTEAKKPSYKLKIDFGNFGIKNSSAQITKLYKKEDLIGRLVVAVVNFSPKQIANFFSEVLVLGTVQNDEVILLEPERETKLGGRIS
jgi:tRNA-binding protein